MLTQKKKTNIFLELLCIRGEITQGNSFLIKTVVKAYEKEKEL